MGRNRQPFLGEDVRRPDLASCFRSRILLRPWSRALTLRGLLLVLVASVVIPALVLGGIGLWRVQAEERARAAERLLAQAHGMALLLDSEFARAETLLRVLAGSPSLARGDLDEFRAAMSAASAVFGEAHIGLVDATGTIVLRTNWAAGERHAKALASQTARRALISGETEIGDLHSVAELDEPAISIVVPVFAPGPQRRVVYALGLLLPRQRLLSAITDQRIPPDWIGAVLDRTHTIVARSVREAEHLGRRPRPETLEMMAHTDLGIVRTAHVTLDGVPSISAYARAPRTGFWVGLAMPRTTFGPMLGGMLGNFTIIGVLLLFAGLAAALLIARRIGDALGQLARDIAQTRSGIHEIDEIAGILRRVTDEQKRIATELRDSEARFRATFEQAAVGIAHVGLDGRWLRVNTRLCEKLGYTREELLAKGFQEITHPDDLETDLACVRQMLDGEIASYALEKRYFRKDGSIIWINLTVALARDPDGVARYFISVIEDISQRRRAEDAAHDSEARLHHLVGTLEMRVREEVTAREAAQARAAHAERVQALGQLAGGIAHDFNNVLQTVQGGAALIERRAGDADGVRRLARLILDGTARGASITRRLLAFGRRGDLRAEAVDAGEVLNGLREILGHLLGPTIAIRVDVEPELPPLLADKGQLETALVNLATNARDAMPAGGTLMFSAREEVLPPGAKPTIPSLAPGRYICLSVSDSGTGIDRATLARVFEPFFTTKPQGQGTGLGLAMAKGFAEQSGGGLAIESALGRGTTVAIWLPQATSPVSVVGEARGAAGSQQAETRVLLLDDDALVRETLALQLESAGHAVLAAASGTEALALVNAGEPVDILVTDLSMPDMDGLAVIRGAQERRPGLPAVLLTGYAGDGATLAISGAVSGTFSLLRKPVSASQLLDRVAALLAARAEAPISDRPTRQ